jgi:hypothetical protein
MHVPGTCSNSTVRACGWRSTIAGVRRQYRMLFRDRATPCDAAGPWAFALSVEKGA